MAEKKRWSDLTPVQQRAIVLGGAAEAVVTTAALVDLARRGPDRVRGRRWLWVLSFVVQPVGPLAYLAFGRRA
jgi:hypothetical protein